MIYLFIKQYYKSIIIGLLILWLSLSGSKTMFREECLTFLILTRWDILQCMHSFRQCCCSIHPGGASISHFRYTILLIPLLFGALMEIMQMTLTTSRKAETIDLLANIGGVSAGILLAHIAQKILQKLGLISRMSPESPDEYSRSPAVRRPEHSE